MKFTSESVPSSLKGFFARLRRSFFVLTAIKNI